jgi:4-hydroxy-tetrahydrodipicolinate reductase
MSHEVVKAAMRRGLSVADIALSGPRAVCPKWLQATGEVHVDIGGQRVEIKVVTPDEAGAQQRALEEAKARYGSSLVIVDFTHGSAVNSNAELYTKVGVDFVMGTTGGDRELLQSVAEKGDVYAVIAPNLNKQILALQVALRAMSTSFPGIFEGYQLEITESHPETKTDMSAPAEDILQSFKAMGVSYDPASNLKQIRSRSDSMKIGVSEEHLKSHAFHTYTVTSQDGNAAFKFEHNISGSTPIAEGAVDAVRFLVDRKAASDKKRIFDMNDMLGVASSK